MRLRTVALHHLPRRRLPSREEGFEDQLILIVVASRVFDCDQ